MYSVTKIYEPYDLDENQDMWVGEISYKANDYKDPLYNHKACIEVRAIESEELNAKMNVIVSALNEAL